MTIMKYVIARKRTEDMGLTLVDSVKSTKGKVFYCVDKKTGLYSFWKITGLHKLSLIDTGLSRSDAKFKLIMFGGY